MADSVKSESAAFQTYNPLMFLTLRVACRTAGNTAFRTSFFENSMLKVGREAQKNAEPANLVERHRSESKNPYERLCPRRFVKHLIDGSGNKFDCAIRARRGERLARCRLNPLTIFFSCCSPAAVRKCWRLLEEMIKGGSRTDGASPGG